MAENPPPRPQQEPVPRVRRLMLLQGGAACAGLDDGSALVLQHLSRDLDRRHTTREAAPLMAAAE